MNKKCTDKQKWMNVVKWVLVLYMCVTIYAYAGHSEIFKINNYKILIFDKRTSEIGHRKVLLVNVLADSQKH